MKDYIKIKKAKQSMRARRVKAKLFGTAKRPRVAVKRSLKHVHVQAVDDNTAKTIAAATDMELKSKKGSGVEIASQVGELIAKKLMDKKIKTVLFDRKGYKYHGRVKALADGMRSGGLEF